MKNKFQKKRNKYFNLLLIIEKNCEMPEMLNEVYKKPLPSKCIPGIIDNKGNLKRK